MFIQRARKSTLNNLANINEESYNLRQKRGFSTEAVGKSSNSRLPKRLLE